MRRSVPGRRAVPAATLAVMLALIALAGCAQSSNTTSSSHSAPGGGTPTATTLTTATSPPSTTPRTATTPTTATTTTTAPASVPGLTVSPAVAAPHSVIHFAVTPTYRTAGQSGDISNALTVTGPQKPGCVGVHNQGLSALPAGRETTVSVGPAQIGGNWCPGTYSARVVVLERPKCGPGEMCPQFIRVLAAIGPVSFRISG
jgi:hypothetical protein